MLAFDPMPAPYRVALLGFNAFEHSALASSLRLATRRLPCYEYTAAWSDADFVVADAGHAPAAATGRLADTVFVGVSAPAGAGGWMVRPIDPTQVLRALDRLVALKVPPPAPERPALPASGTPAPRQQRALLVDDSEIALRFLEAKLQMRNLQTERAAQSGKAIELLAQRKYEFVFLDVDLGTSSDLDGLMLCQHIKRQRHPTADAAAPVVVMVSAHHSQLDRARGAFAGCDAYLGKPLDEVLLDRVLLLHAHE